MLRLAAPFALLPHFGAPRCLSRGVEGPERQIDGGKPLAASQFPQIAGNEPTAPQPLAQDTLTTHRINDKRSDKAWPQHILRRLALDDVVRSAEGAGVGQRLWLDGRASATILAEQVLAFPPPTVRHPFHGLDRKLEALGAFAHHSLNRRLVVSAMGAGQAAILDAVGLSAAAVRAGKSHDLAVLHLLRRRHEDLDALDGGIGGDEAGGDEWFHLRWWR